MKLLTDLKEMVLLVDEPASVTMKSASGDQPIHVFAVRGDLDGVARCLEFGADIDAPGEYGFTPLHEAATNGHTQVVKFLVDHGANIDARNDWGDTAFEATAALTDNALVETLNLLGAARDNAAPQPDRREKR
jgi:ankyrin repeat protein